MMISVIDCGTTTSRIYIVESSSNQIVASKKKKIGVRDTSMTGSNDALRNGLASLFFETVEEAHLHPSDISFLIASGMIGSEVGLIDVPHLTAPAGLKELSEGLFEVSDTDILPVGIPLYIVRGIKNAVTSPDISGLEFMDFMRGEEVQYLGILKECNPPTPCNVITLSSHTKIAYINELKQIEASITSISGQFREAVISATSIGKSLRPYGEKDNMKYNYEQIVETAYHCVATYGLLRVGLMPRFMQVLMDSNYADRELFFDAAIAADDMRMLNNIKKRGYTANTFILYGKKERCRLYRHLIKRHFNDSLNIICISDENELDQLTVTGSMAIASEKIKMGLLQNSKS